MMLGIVDDGADADACAGACESWSADDVNEDIHDVDVRTIRLVRNMIATWTMVPMTMPTRGVVGDCDVFHYRPYY